MTALEHAEQLRQEAITILVKERERIDAQLIQLGYGEKSPVQRRGRKPKQIQEEGQPQRASRFEMTAPAAL